MAKRSNSGSIAGDEAAAVDAVRAGYSFDEPALELGVLVVDDGTHADVPVRIPLSMVNRHGLVAGATGTGKTKTLQLMAEQLSAHGVPVFAADMKGDLSGIATPGQPGDRVSKRATEVGQDWRPGGCPVEYYALGGRGTGIPLRATITSFGPTLLSKVLGLNAVQESSLGLVFHYADSRGLTLLDLKDLRAVVQHLTSDEGKADLKELGGLSASTAGVILRQLITFSDQGADAFFGEPEFDTSDLMRLDSDGRGVVSLAELPELAQEPALFSTFLMWLLADLFESMPEVGDVEKPKLVFFFDEAHLLFADASKAFLASIAQTVRLIRSKGVGVFFVTQTPKDVPDDVLAQLGSRVQHALRAHTPNDAKVLRATVATFPRCGYDLEEVLTTLGIGEAVITVMDPDGAPTPVAWTKLRAPQSLMAPTPAEVMAAAVQGSPLMARYGQLVDRESAYERLAARVVAETSASAGQVPAPKAESGGGIPLPRTGAPQRAPRSQQDKTVVEEVLGSTVVRDLARTAGREILRGIFGSRRRR